MTEQEKKVLIMKAMSAALEIAERFNPRKMPWIFSVIEKHMLEKEE